MKTTRNEMISALSKFYGSKANDVCFGLMSDSQLEGEFNFMLNPEF